MATYLYRLGAWAFERRRVVAGLWAFALAAVLWLVPIQPLRVSANLSKE